MALDITNRLSLLELTKRSDPNGEAAKIAEIMTQTNEIMNDLPWVEANNVTSNKIVQRVALPTGSWRGFNEGVKLEKSATRQLNEPIGMLEAYSECDKALCDIAPNPVEYRMSEAASFIEGMSQTLANAMFYGDHDENPRVFDGIVKRINSLGYTWNGHTPIASCGAPSGDMTSVYVIQWGPEKVFMAYPRHSKTAGIEHQDLGEKTLYDGDANPYQGYRDHFKSFGGLNVKNPLCLGRVCNIQTTGTSALFDEDKLVQVLNEMYMGGKGAVIYVNRTVKTQMEIALIDRANIYFTSSEGLGGRPILSFRGVPVRLVDSISDTETKVV